MDGELIDPEHESRDLRMLNALAKRKDWVIPDKVYETLPKVAAEILASGEPKEQIAAGRLLVSMNGQNQKNNPAPKKFLHKHRHTVSPSGPVTEENLEERRRINLERLAAGRQDAGGDAVG